jgi:S1-C subfamily serine protease
VRRGDILLSIAGQETNSARDVASALAGLAEGDSVELVVMHGDDERTLEVEVAEQSGRVYLGIQPYYGRGLTDERQFELSVERMAGAVIMEVVAGGPAAEAGLEVGDLITSVNGEQLNQELSLGDAIAALEPGDSATLTVQRTGEDEALSLAVTLGENPDDDAVAYLGVRYSQAPAIGFEQMPFFGEGEQPDLGDLPFFQDDEVPFSGDGPMESVEQGLVVISVVEDGPAAAAGVMKGDLITAVDGVEVSMRRDLVDILAEHAPGDVVALAVMRAGDEEAEAVEIEVTLGAHPDDETLAYLGVGLGSFRRMLRQGLDGDMLPFEKRQSLLEKLKAWSEMHGGVPLPFDLPFDLQEEEEAPLEEQVEPLDLQELFPGLFGQSNS